MGFYTTDTILDQALSFLAQNCDGLSVCTTQPASFGEAFNTTSSVIIARTSSGVSATSSSDFTLGDSTRAAGGRALQVSTEFEGLPVVSSGNARHVAMFSFTSSSLLHIAKVSSQLVGPTNTLSIPTFKVELSDPTSDSEI